MGLNNMENLIKERNLSLKKLTSSNLSNQEFNNIININYVSGVLPPPNPLPVRKNIPLNSPKFGRNFNYIKLNPFRKQDEDKKNKENDKDKMKETLKEIKKPKPC